MCVAQTPLSRSPPLGRSQGRLPLLSARGYQRLGQEEDAGAAPSRCQGENVTAPLMKATGDKGEGREGSSGEGSGWSRGSSRDGTGSLDSDDNRDAGVVPTAFYVSMINALCLF